MLEKRRGNAGGAVLGVIGLIVGIIGILLAWQSDKENRETLAKFDAQLKRIEYLQTANAKLEREREELKRQRDDKVELLKRILNDHEREIERCRGYAREYENIRIDDDTHPKERPFLEEQKAKALRELKACTTALVLHSKGARKLLSELAKEFNGEVGKLEDALAENKIDVLINQLAVIQQKHAGDREYLSMLLELAIKKEWQKIIDAERPKDDQ